MVDAYKIRYQVKQSQAWRCLGLIFSLLACSWFRLTAQEQTLLIGGEAGWQRINLKQTVVETSGLSPNPALTLSSAQITDPRIDIDLNFDKPTTAFSDTTANYRMEVDPSLNLVGPLRARKGAGAALFVDGGLTMRPLTNQAFLAPGIKRTDFSLEFWLYPANLSNGEQLLAWSAIKHQAGGPNISQALRCQVVRNRLEWSFTDFFTSADGQRSVELELRSRLLVPLTWSHHLIRFDSATGLLEYIVNGTIDSAVYATASGAEGTEVYLARIGQDGILNIGARYSGLLDDFRLWPLWLTEPMLDRYPLPGGRIETEILDLSQTNSLIKRLEVKQTRLANSDFAFFLRSSDQGFFKSEEDSDWRPIAPNQDLGEAFRGRWAQLAVEFYPDGSGEITPILEELKLIFLPDEAPVAPSGLMARPGNGQVELHWRPSPDADVAGYLLYFGERSAYYWGKATESGSSPIDVGQRTSYIVDGLVNGVLYYFTVAAYDRADPPHLGDFAHEVSARPARISTP